LRPSSIVLLTRARTAGTTASVYLVERAPALSFFGGFHALPGGNVDPRDRGADRADGDERALAVCAARELFEETGVLLPGLARGLGAAERARLRNALIDDTADAARFWELVAAAPDALAALRPFGVLITPPFAPVRYRTRLYHLELPAGEEPAVIPGELSAGAFHAPADALASWRRGEVRIAPPVVFLLEELARRPLEAALAHATAVCDDVERGALHPARCSPGILMVPLATPTIPPATTTNAYIVGAERLCVIDPATPDPADQARFFALLDRLLAEGRRLGEILVTHHHADHVGAVAATARRYGLAVRAHARTLERLPDDGGVDFARGPALADGERLELGRAPDGRAGWGLTCHHTPGHDQGHMIFVEDRYRAALAGDLVSTLSTIVIDPP
jgi:8-oxo-dGTP pyrophosphatase MutT (NUDIX family)